MLMFLQVYLIFALMFVLFMLAIIPEESKIRLWLTSGLIKLTQQAPAKIWWVEDRRTKPPTEREND